MNSKKAKRIRQLVKHLQSKGAITNVDWDQTVIEQGTNKLHPESGRAVYQQMKKVGARSGKAH